MIKVFYFLAPAFTLLIIYGSLTSNPNVPIIDVNNIDKIYHGTAYFLLTILWYFFFYQRYSYYQSHVQFDFSTMYRNWVRSIAIGAGFLCALIGGIVEIAQGYLAENRTMDAYDMIANVSGIVIAVLLLKGTSSFTK